MCVRHVNSMKNMNVVQNTIFNFLFHRFFDGHEIFNNVVLRFWVQRVCIFFGCSSTNVIMIDLDYCDFRDNVCRLISFNVDLCFRIMSKCIIFTNLIDAKRHWHTALKTNSEQRIWIWFKSSNGSRQIQSSEDIILTDLFRENPRTKFEDVYLNKMHSEIWM